jgi:hypothetical protein
MPAGGEYGWSAGLATLVVKAPSAGRRRGGAVQRSRGRPAAIWEALRRKRPRGHLNAIREAAAPSSARAGIGMRSGKRLGR